MKSNSELKPRILRKMGYLSDSHGIIERHIQLNGAWDKHIQQTRRFILNVLEGKRFTNIAVYGSGWLLDLPLEELSTIADRIWLYDVIHPHQVLHALRKFNNVIPVIADITGGSILAAYESVRIYKKSGVKPDLVRLCEKRFIPEEPPDYAISLNILSQIPEIMFNYLVKHASFEDEEIDRFKASLQKGHLDMLIHGKSCIITDTLEECYNKDNQLVKTNNLIKCLLPSSKKTSDWEWQFDPIGEYNAGLKTVSRVIAFEL